VFNMLGPLLNPSRPEGQLAGVFNESLVSLYADVLPGLGRSRAWVVHGRAGDAGVMDEISTLGPTIIAKVSSAGAVVCETVQPADLGVAAANVDALRGGDAAANAQLLLEILGGKQLGAPRDIVLVNAAAALVVAGLTEDWAEAMARAAESIDSGSAATVLQRMRRIAAA
jgi:anthranilate phosphoribosyltransferase